MPTKSMLDKSLKIYTNKTTWVTYTVKSGDNLSVIAQKYGVSVSDIKMEQSKVHQDLRGTET